MSTFFRQTAQAMIAKHIDRFPLLKLDQVIDWQPIEQYLNRQRTRYLRDHRGRHAYPLLSMFKAVLLGQWHSLSDPELEHSLITRIDFNLFCRFDELSIPDYSTLCRYRNRRRKTTPCPNCWLPRLFRPRRACLHACAQSGQTSQNPSSGLFSPNGRRF